MSFSERYGLKPLRDVVQINSIDDPLRNGLWSLLKLHCWDRVRGTSGMYSGFFLSENEEHQILCRRIWYSYFKSPLDELSNDWTNVVKILRNYFFSCEWNEVYDFVEFVSKNFELNSYHENFQESFNDSCNLLFEREMSAYRFVGGVITRIADEQQIDEIETALSSTLGPVGAHLKRSLEMLSDRDNRDYRNSIKESISAVESYVKLSLGEENGTLGDLLKRLKGESGLHPALSSAFSNLYGYTSDEGGIRHAMTESDSTSFEDAKFMIVVCSAFINFSDGKLG